MSDVVTVLIRGLEVFGRHGVFAAEQELGQQFVIDVELELLACPGVSTDELDGTADYAELARGIARIVYVDGQQPGRAGYRVQQARLVVQAQVRAEPVEARRHGLRSFPRRAIPAIGEILVERGIF